MSSTTQNVSASHNSGTAPTATPSNTSGDNSATASASGGDTTYPEQIHAGKVGYGPNYRTGPSLEDKIQGLKEELKGKVTRNSELVEHGRQVKSGEEKRKKLTGEDEPNPFTNAKDDDSEEKNNVHNDSAGPTPTHEPSNNQPNTSDAQHSQPSTHGPVASSNNQPDTYDVQHSQPSTHAPVASSNNQPDTYDAQHSQQATHTPVASGLNGPIGIRDGEIQGLSSTQSPHAHFESSRGAQQDQNSSQTDPFGMAPSQVSGQQYKANTNTSTDSAPHQSQPLNRTPAPAPTSNNFGSDDSVPQQPPKANPFGMAVNQGHGKGAMEQAATVAPEGTEDAERQRKGNNVDFGARPVEARQ